MIYTIFLINFLVSFIADDRFLYQKRSIYNMYFLTVIMYLIKEIMIREAVVVLTFLLSVILMKKRVSIIIIIHYIILTIMYH